MPAAFLLLLGLLLASCAGGGSQSAGSVDAAGAAPLAFSAQTVDGGPFDATELTGRPAVLWFWASWCTVCAAESGTVREFSERVGPDVAVLGVAGLGSPREDAAGFVERHRLSGIAHLFDADGSLFRQFGVTRQPTFAFVSADGSVQTVPGRMSVEELLQRAATL